MALKSDAILVPERREFFKIRNPNLNLCRFLQILFSHQILRNKITQLAKNNWHYLEYIPKTSIDSIELSKKLKTT